MGKSSLINLLLGEKLSIVNSKSQTTRHNIKGFIHGDDHQLILVDTPGFIDEPAYQLQLNMNSYIELALEEADIIVMVVDKYNMLSAEHPLIKEILRAKKPLFVVINKIDQCQPEEVNKIMAYYEELLPVAEMICLSVELKLGRDSLVELLLKYLPLHPPYYDHSDWTDRNMRFFASEIIREKIFLNYKKEIPYSCEVVVTSFKEEETIIRIASEIYVERVSQRAILIGHKGESIKKVGIQARAELEKFFGKHVFLEQFVKVEPDWRGKADKLRSFGYALD